MRVLLRLRLGSILGIAVFLISQLTEAKDVEIQWTKLDRAASYELEVRQGNQVVLSKALAEPKWSGELQAGAYFYRVRAVDLATRPGQWSAWLALAVLPEEPPKLVHPTNGKQFIRYTREVPIELKWNPVSGAKRYLVQIHHNGKLVAKKIVQKTTMILKRPPHGQYKWSVQPEVVLSKTQIQSETLLEKQWRTQGVLEAEFEVDIRKLEAANLDEPLDRFPPTDSKFVSFKWDAVEGAERYKIFVKPLAEGQSLEKTGRLRKPVSEKGAKVVYSDATEVKMKLTKEGGYTWSVQPLAHLDAQKKPGVTGPVSSGAFVIDRNSIYGGDLGYLALSTMLAPYRYEISSPSLGISGGTQATSLALRLSGEYWAHPLWGISLGMDLVNFSISGKQFSRRSFEVLGKYRTSLSPGKYGWSISPKAGLEYRSYNQIFPTDLSDFTGGVSNNDISVVGASLGFDLRKRFTNRLSLGMKGQIFIPLSLAGAPSEVTGLDGSSTFRNMSIGVQGLFWLNRSLGVGLGGFFELRSIGYQTNIDSRPESIITDGAYFFGSIVYKIPR